MTETTYTVGRLARLVGLSRTALLYYERIGLLCASRRNSAGYRVYDQADLDRLRKVLVFRDAGLSLAAIADILRQPHGERASDAFQKRLADIQREMRLLREQQAQLAALSGTKAAAVLMGKDEWVDLLRRSGMSDNDMDRWHQEFERTMPRAHNDFLISLGIDKREVARIRQAAGADVPKS